MKMLGWTKDRRSLDLKKLQFAQSQKWVAGMGMLFSLSIAFYLEAVKNDEFALGIVSVVVLGISICCWISVGTSTRSFDSLFVIDSEVSFRCRMLPKRIITGIVFLLLSVVGSSVVLDFLGVAAPNWLVSSVNVLLVFMLGVSFTNLAGFMFTPGQDVFLYKKMSRERQILLEDIQEKQFQIRFAPVMRGILLLLGGEVFQLKAGKAASEFKELLGDDRVNGSFADGAPSIRFLDVDEVGLEPRDSFLKLMKVARVVNSNL